VLESGIDIATVSKTIGHSDINLTIRTYFHPENSLREAVEELAILAANCRKICSTGLVNTRRFCVRLSNYCVPDWIRTSGLRIRNPALYPAELRGRSGDSNHYF
jgi:hypothetical protein